MRLERTRCTEPNVRLSLSQFWRHILEMNFKRTLVTHLTPFTWTKTTDISVNKLLCICIKHRSKKHNRFVSTYLGRVELLDADANGIVDAFTGFLQANVLDIANLVGKATDGASLMVGRQPSVYTVLKQKQPNLQLIRCVCHSLDIVAQKAMQQLPSNIEYIIRETYNWFAFI